MSTRGRDQVLGDIRRALGRERLDEETIARLKARTAAPPKPVQARFEIDPIEQFMAKLNSPTLTASGEQVGEWQALPQAVARYLKRNELAPRLALAPDPEVTALAWGDIAIHHEIDRNEPISLSVARFGIAETGTLVFHSSPQSPTLFNYLPLHHLAVLWQRHLLSYMDDYWAWRREANEPQPRNINFITGTSGTADIEAKLVRGAHGPRFLHVLLVAG